MEILKFLYVNFPKTLLILIWVICGMCAIVIGSAPLVVAASTTIWYGVYRLLFYILSDD